MSIERLCIITHVVHYRHGNRLYAYGPYAREIDVWADLFPQLIIAAPCKAACPPADALAFTRSNISLVAQPESGGDTLRARIRQLLMLPLLMWSLSRALRQADAICVRCPGNLGLLGVLLAPIFSPYHVAKYAGQWVGYPEETFSIRLQKAILRSRWWRGPVTVYGDWPGQPPKIIPFFTSIMTAEQMRRAQAAARNKKIRTPLRVLYVGRLAKDKNVDVMLSAIASLGAGAGKIRCTIIGEGPQRSLLENQVARLNLQEHVRFAGGMAFERVLDFYEQADVLVLASQSEGWPKAMVEAMAFGLVGIASNRGLIPHMLDDGRGMLVPPGEVVPLALALRRLIAAPGEFTQMSRRAAHWAQGFSLENLREALRDLLSSQWHIPLESRQPSACLEPRSLNQ